MDGSNVTKENPSNFEDEISDQDLEARLYAEIYYAKNSNERDYEQIPKENETNTDTINTAPGSSRSNLTLDSHPVLPSFRLQSRSKFGSRQPQDTFSIEPSSSPADSAPTQSNFWLQTPSVFDSRQDLFLGDESCRFSDSGPAISRIFSKKRRLLSQENLWSTTRARVRAVSSRDRQNRPSAKTRASVPKQNANRQPKADTRSNHMAEHRSIDVENYEKSCDPCCGQFPGTSKKDSAPPRNPKTRKKNAGAIKSGEFEVPDVPRNRKRVNNERLIRDASKYDMIAKRKKPPVESVEISSDSDDSILELPIPPKAQPPVIRVSDSGDSSDEAENIEIEVISNGNISRNDETESPERSFEISSRTDPDQDRDDLVINAVSSTEEIPETGICEKNVVTSTTTDVHPGTSSSNENADTLETRNFSHVHRPAFSHYNNFYERQNCWTGNATKTGDEFIYRAGDFTGLENSSFSDDWIFDNFTETSFSEKDLSRPMDNFPPGEGNSVRENTFGSPVRQEENGRRKRKRREVRSSNSAKISSVPEVPEKKSCPGTVDENRPDASWTEYIFKPMPKELQAFYNNPWGGENLDVCDIQSRMPSNPRSWSILAADLIPSPKRRGRICPRCKTHSHFGRKCPGKPSQPICCICGLRGHVETRCPQTMCLTCGHKYSTFRQTCGHCSKMYCRRCTGKGHTHERCPDLWRRYHDTTIDTPPLPKDPANTMKPHHYLSCCNCAKRGHDSTTCMQLRWSQHFSTSLRVSNYTDGPSYQSSRREIIEDSKTCENVEIVEAPEDNNRSQFDPATSSSEETLLFQYGDIDFPKSIKIRKRIRRLHTLKNVCLQAFLAGDSKPTFLETWRNEFLFNVRITRRPENQIVLMVNADSRHLANGIQKLLLQWFTRKDDEKPYLIHDALRYGDRQQMILELGKKVGLLKRSMAPANILEKISVHEEFIKLLDAPATVRASKKREDTEPQRKLELQQHVRNLAKRRSQLVTSLYAHCLVEGAAETVQSFYHLTSSLRRRTVKRFPVKNYLELVYLYNEMFTFHESDELSEALKKATAESV